MVARLTYTVPEVAELLGISRSTAYECVRRGDVPALVLGRRVLIARTTVDALLSPAARPEPQQFGYDGLDEDKAMLDRSDGTRAS